MYAFAMNKVFKNPFSAINFKLYNPSIVYKAHKISAVKTEVVILTVMTNYVCIFEPGVV